jgi:hypothetical protein
MSSYDCVRLHEMEIAARRADVTGAEAAFAQASDLHLDAIDWLREQTMRRRGSGNSATQYYDRQS